MFRLAKSDPAALLAAARSVAANGPIDTPTVRDLKAWLDRAPAWSTPLLARRPEALVEAVQMLIAHPDQIRAALLREPFTDPGSLGGYLDRDLP